MLNSHNTAVASFTVDRRQFRDALARLATTIPKRSRKAVLQNAKISVNGTVELSGTDTERWQSETLEPMLKRGDAVALIELATLRATISASSAELVTVEALADGGIKIDGGAMLAAGCPVDEYPYFAHFGQSDVIGGRWFGSAAALAELIESTVYCTDSESSRYALGALLVELPSVDSSADSIRLVGTDGRRLTAASIGQPLAEPATALLAASFAKAAAKAAKAKRAKYAMIQTILETPPAVDENEAEQAEAVETPPARLIQVFTFDGSKTVISAFSFRVVDGRFPNWRHVVPHRQIKRENRVAEFSAPKLAELVNQAKAARVPGSDGVTLRFRETGRRSTTAVFAIVRNTAQRFCGSVNATISRRAKTCLSADYVSQLLAAVGKKPLAVEVSFQDENSAVSFDYSKTVDGVTVDVEAVIMPLSVDKKPTRTTPAEIREAEAAQQTEAAAA